MLRQRLIKLVLLLAVITLVSLGNYQLAKLIQRTWLSVWPTFSYMWAIVIPWVSIGLILCRFDSSRCGLVWNGAESRVNWRRIAAAFALLAIGMTLFIVFGVSKYFHNVKSPIVFVLFTPIVEELIFRGWIYGQIEKRWKWPVVASAIFFGVHHLQYFGYHFTTFAIFQIVYTFFLGLILGKMRRDSGSIYLPLVAHIALNWATLVW